jgi:hypothetical protein
VASRERAARIARWTSVSARFAPAPEAFALLCGSWLGVPPDGVTAAVCDDRQTRTEVQAETMAIQTTGETNQTGELTRARSRRAVV